MWTTARAVSCGIERREYAHGTSLDVRGPWGLYTGGAARCADGKVRRLARIAATADTAFSVPAAVRVRGSYVSGYVTISTPDGTSSSTEANPAFVEFRAHIDGRNAHLLNTTDEV